MGFDEYFQREIFLSKKRGAIAHISQELRAIQIKKSFGPQAPQRVTVG
jgi:hypothetical protein